MKKSTILMFAVVAVIMGCNPEKPTAQIPRNPEISYSKDTIGTLVLTKENEMQIVELRKKIVQKRTCPGGFPIPIAVSATGHWKHSCCSPIILDYDNTLTNEGNAWFGNSMFKPPCGGLYYFSISFVTDSYYPAAGSLDDVSIKLSHNGIYVGEAWAGEVWPMQIGGTTRTDRRCGVYNVILRLNPNEEILTWVSSDGYPNQQYPRTIAYYNFSAYRIGD